MFESGFNQRCNQVMQERMPGYRSHAFGNIRHYTLQPGTHSSRQYDTFHPLFLSEYFCFYQFTDDMPDGDVCLLDTWSIGRRHIDE